MGLRRGARPDGSGRPDAGTTSDPDTSRTDAEFTAYALSSAGRLRDAAYLMCRDWHLAEDLTQTALTKLYVAWPRVSKAEDVNAYARKVLLRGLLDHRRRRWVGEVATGSVPDAADLRAPDLRLTLVDALAALKPIDRAVVLLRYWDDYSVEQVASILDVGESAVRNRSKRALAQLRQVLGADLTELLD
jgi:RNA polymerase sigma-70 factor (sigma-E family)